MKTKELKENAMDIIFFGSVWGILEATLGYAFHLLPHTISGMLMFPFANVILLKAYKEMETRKALLFIGVIAAAIKSIDFLLPGLSIFKTINPMISIILEAMIIAVFCPYFLGKSKKKEYLSVISASVGWRLSYLLYLSGSFLMTGSKGKYIASFSNGFTFLLINGIASGLFAIGVLMIFDNVTTKTTQKTQIKPVFAFSSLVFATILQYVL